MKKTHENYLMNILTTSLNRFLALILLILLLPLLLIVSLLILIFNGWPIIYTQKRIGKNHKIFKIYKFRTMVKNADELRKELEPLNQMTPPDFWIPNDPRVTKLGKFLRKTSIDELPQLINVLKGDMNFIGVRPLLIEENEPLTEAHFKYNPGLTGPTQIYRNKHLAMKEKIKLEEDFVNNYTFKNKIKIFFKTFLVLFKGD